MIDAAQTAVWVAAALAVVSALTAWRGRRSIALSVFAASAATLWFAVFSLGRALVQSDFSVVYVVEHSRQSSAAHYRLAGLWGGMEGSLLLWAAILSTVIGFALARHALSRVTHVVGSVLVLTTTLIVGLAADPFARLAIPAISGRGLTPILDHPAMLIHPPVLYTGLLLTATPFLLAVDAGVRRDASLDIGAFRRAVRGASVMLGVGLVLGANWAYAELGWGGYWAWDPVENAALMPWLGLLAWMHVARAAWSTPRLVAALAAVPMVLVFFGAWMTRAGVSESVHAFAEAPGVGRGFVVLAGGAAVGGIFVAIRRPGPLTTSTSGPTIVPAALAGFLLLAVALGTSYPLLREAFTDDVVTVGGSYFSRAAWPLAVVAGLALATLVATLAQRIAPVGGVVGLIVGIAVDLPWFGVVLAAVAGAALGAAIRGLATDPSRRPIHLAHFGFALMLLGIAGTTGTTTESFLLDGEEPREHRGEQLQLRDITVEELGGGRTAVTARLVIGGTELSPARVAHTETRTVLAETDTDNRWNGDLQVVLRDVTDSVALVELRYRPLAGFIWWGAGLMLLGLALARRVSSAGADRRLSGVASVPPADPEAAPSASVQDDPVASAHDRGSSGSRPASGS